MRIHEEGFRFSLPIILIGGGLLFLGHLFFSLPVFILALAVLAFFRDPHRSGSDDPRDILSPADGKIVAISSLSNESVRISVFMNLHNVHVNRSPVSGRVMKVTHRPGAYLAAWAPKASEINEANTVEVETPQGVVRFTQIAGLVARRIMCWIPEGRSLQTGDRFGLIRFGSRVDLDLPANEVDVRVTLGQKVRAGETVVAKWVS